MLTCTRRLTWCAGHRVQGHEGHCRRLHGHNYRVLLTARVKPLASGIALPHRDQLDDLGRVVDFSVLKDKIGGWIEAHWDHSFIVDQSDGEALAALAKVEGQTVYKLRWNPTAENLARYLLEIVGPRVLEGLDVELIHVKVYETDNCSASASKG